VGVWPLAVRVRERWSSPVREYTLGSNGHYYVTLGRYILLLFIVRHLALLPLSFMRIWSPVVTDHSIRGLKLLVSDVEQAGGAAAGLKLLGHEVEQLQALSYQDRGREGGECV